MELHGRQLFDILEKPLDLATKLFFGLAKGDSFSSNGGSHNSYYKPSPSTHSPITSNPLIPAFLVLLIAFLVLSSSPVQAWLDKADGLPTLSQIFSFSRKKQTSRLPKASENVNVWARKRSGFYYCEGGTLFGSKPGVMMAQVDALMSGYRPSDGEYCAGGQPLVASARGPSIEHPQPQPSADISPPQEESLAQISMKAPDISAAEAGVRVWAIKEFGSYYCRGEILFGERPGRLMTQSDALVAGYRPSEGRCTNNKRNQVDADNPMVRPQQPRASPINSPHEVESLALMKKPPAVSKAEGSVKVWVKTEFGFFYCKNDVLFGNKPGKLMPQAAALTAGYQPSDARCTTDKPTRAAAERLPSRGFSGTK